MVPAAVRLTFAPLGAVGRWAAPVASRPLGRCRQPPHLGLDRLDPPTERGDRVDRLIRSSLDATARW